MTSLDPLVLLRRAGEGEGPPGLLADRGEDGERDAHVHGVAERVADQGVRPVHAPAEAPARRGREHLVLLDVVEVLDRQPRLLLAERRLGLGARVGLEGAEIVLEARHQRHVAEVGRVVQRVQDVADHGAVDGAVLGLGGLPRPGGEEDVGGLDRRQRPADALGVAQVGRDRADPGRRGLGVAGEAVDGPAARLQQVLGEVAAGDAGDAHDQRGRCHGLLPGPARGGPLVSRRSAAPARRGCRGRGSRTGAAQRRVGREARQRRLGHRGDVEHVEVRAAEHSRSSPS